MRAHGKGFRGPARGELQKGLIAQSFPCSAQNQKETS